MFKKTIIQWFHFDDCCRYYFDSLESVEMFRFEKKARGFGNIKPIRSRRSVTDVLLYWNMVIDVGTGGYQTQYVRVTRPCNRGKCTCDGQ